MATADESVEPRFDGAGGEVARSLLGRGVGPSDVAAGAGAMGESDDIVITELTARRSGRCRRRRGGSHRADELTAPRLGIDEEAVELGPERVGLGPALSLELAELLVP